MKAFRIIGLGLLGFVLPQLAAQEFMDRLDEALTITLGNDNIRARLSGLLDLEQYYFTPEAPGLIYSGGHSLFNPRLTLFLDAQIGPHIYLFAQSRLDRGFDPSDANLEVRPDEYALRVSPWDDGRFSGQAGRFASVVGNWNTRHWSWENPFVTAPLPYENPTAIYDSEAPESIRDFTQGVIESKYEYIPAIWGPSYATGASVSGRLGKFDYAAEVKNSSLSSRPETWDATADGIDHPTVSTRMGFRPNAMWNLGVSASEGVYLRPEARATLPVGRGIGDYHQYVLGQDLGFAWHHWQLWAEVYEIRFEVPRVGSADTMAYYLEAKYKFTPQLFGAVRWNQELFGSVPDGAGGRTAWGSDVWRTDFAVVYRFTAHAQIKLQYSLQEEYGQESKLGHLMAGQFSVRF